MLHVLGVHGVRDSSDGDGDGDDIDGDGDGDGDNIVDVLGGHGDRYSGDGVDGDSGKLAEPI